MRLAVIDGRASLVEGGHLADVEAASDGRFGSDAAGLYPRWREFIAWAGEVLADAPRRPIPADAAFGSPSPAPGQAFGVGVNYADHAGEASMAVPSSPMIFSKFPSSITGMTAPLVVDVPQVDWEVELVAVVGTGGRDIDERTAWDALAGLTIGQDISDRELQFADSATPQFNLGKSRAGYGPVGPWLVTLDEFVDPSDLAISCTRNGELVQQSRTGLLLNPVPRLVAYLSSIVELRPGDLIFTGTPSGVGFTREPPVFLQPGDELISTIEGIGELRTVAAR